VADRKVLERELTFEENKFPWRPQFNAKVWENWEEPFKSSATDLTL